MSELTPCPPWLLERGRDLLERDAADRLPHALLVAGESGIGKRAFARWLAEALLCLERGADGACGVCRACRQLVADAHPDFLVLAPDGPSETIRVDAVRELVEWLQLTARGGGYRTALLLGADTLNRNAANALLKTLEEPGEQGLAILVADRAAALPATVRSRCQTLSLRVGERRIALEWLAARVDDPERALARARGRPFAALEALGETREREEALLLAAWTDLFLHRASVGRIVDSIAELPTARCLAAFSHWTALALRLRSGLGAGVSGGADTDTAGTAASGATADGVAADGADGADRAVTEAITAVAPLLETENWFAIHDAIARLHRADGASFRTRTVLEGLLADIRLTITRGDRGIDLS